MSMRKNKENYYFIFFFNYLVVYNEANRAVKLPEDDEIETSSFVSSRRAVNIIN